MNRTRARRFTCARPLAAALLLAAAVSSTVLFAADPPAVLESIRLEPRNPTLRGAHARQRLLVIGTYRDRIERDLTARSRFSVARPELASVDASGRVTALADGETTVRAEADGRTAETTLRLEGVVNRRPFSFARDVGGIFTRRGCNASECHGGVKGQAGFKLSLNALYPRDDYKWIVEGGVFQVLSAESSGPKRPRIDLKEPEKSLILQKPTMSIPHGGGKRFALDSEDYRTLIEWVRKGAPYGESGGETAASKIERVEIFPREGVLEPSGTQRLLVTGVLSDGRREDLSDEVLYASNNPDVAQVDPDGVVKAVATGETSIMVRAAGHAVSARFGVIGPPVARYPRVARNNFIDEHVFRKLERFNIVPSELSGDAEFLRRACLDLTGTLPPPDRVREFLASTDPRKREKLIATLVDTPEYVDFWTFRFSDLFRAASGTNGAPEHGYAYWLWIRDSIASNKPYDQLARERIAAQGYEGPSRHYLPYGQEGRPEETMPEEVRVFLGRRFDCAQCHNHPFESWSQDQFWGLAAFFGRVRRTEWTGFGANVIWDDPAGRDPDYGADPESARVLHPRTHREVQPAFLDGKGLAPGQADDPRLPLAEWLTRHPYFAETLVNRMWGYFFGRGLVDPVDDFRSTNPPSHPELLQALARHFREHGHDLKDLIRLIAGSRAYQLSAVPNETNRADTLNFSHALPRALPAEVLLDAITAVTGVPESFANTMGGEEPRGTRAVQLKMPDLYPSRFLDMYGRASRERVPERNDKANLNQALHLLVGPTYTERLGAEGSRLARLLASRRSDREIIEEFFVAALSRSPSQAEADELSRIVRSNSSHTGALENLVWALLSSREFASNH
jgi:hypothetical protein